MKEANVYADDFWRSFAKEGDLMNFLRRRSQSSDWMRRPAKKLRLLPLEEEKVQQTFTQEAYTDAIIHDTMKHTQMMLKVEKGYYPVRDCAIHTILTRAGIKGEALKRLSPQNYAKIVNLCLQTAKGMALIRFADGKVSAVHGGDESDYRILDMEQIFKETIFYLQQNFPGTKYIPESGSYDHSCATAMWELSGKPELLDTYQNALKTYGVEREVYAPAIRLSTSDVGAKSVTLYQMLLCDSNSRVINLGNPIRLAHGGKADIYAFRRNLDLICIRYQEAVNNLTQLLTIPVRHPVNCMIGMMKTLKIPRKIGNQAVEMFVAQNGEGATNAHEIYYALNEAVFFAACEGKQGSQLLKLEEQLMRVLHFDWEYYDVAGSVSW